MIKISIYFFQWIFGTQNPGAGEEEISEHKEQM